jgi:hypothetical protein
MPQVVLPKGKEKWMNGGIISSDTHKARLLDIATTSTDNVVIASSTNANPIVLTCTSVPAGWAVGDWVIVRNHATNTNANGYWQITAITTGASGTITLGTIPAPGESSLNVQGNGVGGATGTVWNLSVVATPSTIPAAVAGSTDLTLTGVSVTKGKFTATNAPATWSVSPSTLVYGFALMDTTNNWVHFFSDGKHLIRLAKAIASTDTTIIVEPLPYALTAATVIFSNGQSIAITGGTTQGSTSLTCTSAGGAVPIGHTAELAITNFSLPLTTGSPGVQTVNMTIDATNGFYTV